MTKFNHPRIGIAGITGRLGSLCAEESGSLLVGGTSRHADPEHKVFTDAKDIAQRCDVVIDVSHPSLVSYHANVFSTAGCSWVLGTTGLDAAANTAVSNASQHIPVLQAANFSPALTMLLSLARELGAALPNYDAEITEIHHRQKIDAPSGTALAIGRAVAKGREVDFDSVCRTNQSSKRPDGAIGFSSLRGGQVIGEHDLHFFAEDEEITLSHRALDRRVFARGALKAALWLAQNDQPGLYSMENVVKNTQR